MKIDIVIHWIVFKKLCFTVVAIAKFWSEFSVGFVAADDTNRLPALDVQTQCEIASSQFLVFALRGSPQVLRFVFGPSEISTSFPRVSETITEVQIVFVATREGNRISSFRTYLYISLVLWMTFDESVLPPWMPATGGRWIPSKEAPIRVSQILPTSTPGTAP